ncbi:MAG: hypothetical protein ACLP0J_27405 [Solirubrobacteraceae bacterium]
MSKPVTCELGNVTPVIIVPGSWSRAALNYHAEMIASMFALHGSYECVTPRVLVTVVGWAGRDALLDALRRVLKQLPTRFAY